MIVNLIIIIFFKLEVIDYQKNSEKLKKQPFLKADRCVTTPLGWKQVLTIANVVCSSMVAVTHVCSFYKWECCRLEIQL